MKQLAPAFLLAFIVLLSCEKTDQVQPLTGNWNAYITMWTGDTAETRLLTIRQEDREIDFYESADLVSTGVLGNDTILCSDLYGATILFVDNIDHMSSALPLAESAGPVFLERIKE